MAEINPFRGYFYNPHIITDLKDVIAPPYDVIAPEESGKYYSKIHNIIHLTLPQGDKSQDKYHYAATLLNEWIKDEIFARDDSPSLYIYHHRFQINSEVLLRRGFFALVRLEDFGEGRVLPHEETLSSPKEDRFKLLESTCCNLSPVFLLYSDGRGEILRLLEEERSSLLADFTTPDSQVHTLWRVSNKEIHTKVRQIMEDKLLYIADGHHRYEIALRFWKQTKKDMHRWILAYLSPIEDKSLRILPAHRLVKGFNNKDWEKLLRKGREYFWIKEFSLNSIEKSFSILSEEGEKRHAFGILFNDGRSIKSTLLVSKNEKKLQEKMDGHSPAWKHLDISVLHSLIFSHILGFEEESLQRASRLKYEVDRDKTMRLVKGGSYQVGFLLNPTKVKEVQMVAERREKMPGKATYFYPKVPSGLIIHMLER